MNNFFSLETKQSIIGIDFPDIGNLQEKFPLSHMILKKVYNLLFNPSGTLLTPIFAPEELLFFLLYPRGLLCFDLNIDQFLPVRSFALRSSLF